MPLLNYLCDIGTPESGAFSIKNDFDSTTGLTDRRLRHVTVTH